MNYLSVSAIFDPGYVKVTTRRRRDDGHPYAVIAFRDYTGPELAVHIDDLAHVAELESALAQVREYLESEPAATDAA